MNEVVPFSDIPAGTLTKYEAACRALAEAMAVDEVLEVRNMAVAMAAYSKQAKDRQLELDAKAIRTRAERRLGEMMQQQKETVGLAPAGRKSGFDKTQLDSPPTLAALGIDKNLADRARKLAALTPEEFEAEVERQQNRVTNRPNLRVVESDDKPDAEPDEKQPTRASEKTTRKVRKPSTSQEQMVKIYSDGRWHAISDVADRMGEPTDIVRALIEQAVSNGRPRARAKWEQKRGSYRLLFPTEKMISIGTLIEELTPIIKELREQGTRRMETVSTSTIAVAAANLDRLLKEWAK